ncbi:Helicase-related_protein [Hexamita inflata]|uniref:Helicase-related protein n=1 Tax=Hexamita inflata TaxID=28002 RepID=A0AA86RIU9_9EUKA|nr:Helicase-related protein [Hexamita inflata]
MDGFLLQFDSEQLEKLYATPACCMVVYKQLSPLLQYFIRQVTANLLPLYHQQLKVPDEKDIEKPPIIVKPYEYLEQDLSEDEKKILIAFRILFYYKSSLTPNFVFFNGFDQISCRTQPIFSRVMIGKQKLMTAQPIDIESISLQELNDIIGSSDEDEQQELEQLNIESEDFRFQRIVYLLLNIKPAKFCQQKIQNQLKNFIELIQLSKSGQLVQKFILGDSFVQCRIIIGQLIKVFGNSELYKSFNKIVGEVEGLTVRDSQDQQIEQLAQLQFILQIINFPVHRAVILDPNYLKLHQNVLFFLHNLGLVYMIQKGTQTYLAVSDVLSLQQYSSIDQLNYLKNYNLHQVIVNKPLYIESTGRVTFYKSADETQNMLNKALLELFCETQYDLPHAVILNISKTIVKQKQVVSSLVARFLTNNSNQQVPPDLINLLDSWETKTMYTSLGKVAVFKVENDPNQKVCSKIIYYKVAMECIEQKYSIWVDQEYLSEIEKAVKIFKELIYKQYEHVNGQMEKRIRRKTKDAIDLLSEKAAKQRTLVVRFDAAKDVNELFKRQQQELSTAEKLEELERFLK